MSRSQIILHSDLDPNAQIYLKRVALSATYFFKGTSLKSRKVLYFRLSRTYNVNSPDDIRKAFNIHKSPWKVFMADLWKSGLKIRDYNPYRVNYFHCRKDSWDKDSAEAMGVPYVEDNSTELNETVEALTKENHVLKLKNEHSERSCKEMKGYEDSYGSLTVEYQNGKHLKIDSVHKNFKSLLRLLATGANVYLVGPAGTGKTYSASQAAEALGLEFGSMSVGPQSTKHEIFGYPNANGEYVRTIFRDRFEHGGLMLIDEIDAGHPQVLTALNGCLANEIVGFPDKMVKKHPKFLCIAAGNTWGTGPTAQFVGRSKLCATSITRFVFHRWGYDEDLERKIMEAIIEDEHLTTANLYFNEVMRIRKGVELTGSPIAVSSRAIINGAKLINAGFPIKEILDMVLFHNLSESERQRIYNAC